MACPEVSVLMPVYNSERYLRESVESILNQTYTDFEFIIIDDASTDNSWGILTNYAENDHRIILVQNEENIGLTKSLNKGIRFVKGKYIARMDADDISASDRLRNQVEFLERGPGVGLLGSSWEAIDENGQKIGESIAYSGQYAVHFMCHGTAVLRKNCLEEIGPYREIFEYAQDYDLWLRIADVFEIRNIQQPLYKLRVHVDSISVKKKMQQDLYVSLAIELAEERRKTGKDRLSGVSQEEALRIREQRLRISGIKKRKVLSHNYSTWAQAASELGLYRRSLNYIFVARKLYILNFQAWILLLKILAKQWCDYIIKLIKAH